MHKFSKKDRQGSGWGRCGQVLYDLPAPRHGRGFGCKYANGICEEYVRVYCKLI